MNVRDIGGRQRLRTWLFAMLAAWTGCNQIADIHEGQPRKGCQSVNDCDQGEPECRSVECKDHVCVYDDAPDGTLVAGQVVGDCQELLCDGKGRLRVATVDSDNDDGNPCTFDQCIGSQALHQPRPFVECFTGDPLTRGRGICKDGVQACDASGKPVGPCVGEVLAKEMETCSTIFDDDCDGSVNESDGEGCVCELGSIRECYGGPVQTLNVGACVGGYQECVNGLVWGPCTLHVLPKLETCTDLADEDCDGQANENGVDCECGDGWKSNLEVCDEGSMNGGDECTVTCTLPGCGNGTVENGETCDDGNEIDTDDCPRSCQWASCGDGFVHIDVEMCDDGNDVESDGCTTTCTLSNCGNGVVEPELGERCDDGNIVGGDGCQEDCNPTPISLALGYGHSCAVFADGSLKCWGVNYSGELGQGDMMRRGDLPNTMGSNVPPIELGTGRTAKAVVAGGGHTCAILDDDTVKCWGNNSKGQLGLDDTTTRGYQPGSMGDALPIVKLGAKVEAIAAGQTHTCAIIETGDVQCWGDGADGKLGLGDIENRGDDPGEMDVLPIVPMGGKKAISIAAGQNHTCVVQDDYTVRCWGSGSSGRLATGDTANYGDTAGTAGGVEITVGATPVAMYESLGLSSCVRLMNGQVSCWGSNGYCQLGIGTYADIGDDANEVNSLPIIGFGGANTVIESGTGERHHCVLLSGGKVRCMGKNDAGQVGADISCGFAATAQNVDLGLGLATAHLHVGPGHNCVILTNGRVKCWGYNETGQLGLGDTVNRGITPEQMGYGLPPVRLW